MNNYIPTIGIECHVQLKTKTKLFAAVGNDAREAPPNTLISHICVGMPGALPVLNEAAVQLAMRAAFALNSRPQAFSKFDRKHYFYPDLPLGYQITQFDQPIILGGHVGISVDGKPLKIGITRAHLEADAGKLTHPEGADYSLVDLNRAGTPLLEIVSEPDMHSAAEAKTYAKELYLLMKYADVSDVNMYYGNMRFDVNISLSKDPAKLGTRAEIKNLNSFRSVEKAVEYETLRQSELLDKGEKIVQETRGWNDDKQKTFSQRSKEDAHDYRYMPEPDVPPTILTEEMIQAVEKEMPPLPPDYRQKFIGLGLGASQIETIIDEPQTAIFVGSLLEKQGTKAAKTIANWLTGDLQRLVADESLTWGQVVQVEAGLVGLAAMVEDGSLSSTAAKDLLQEVIKNNKDPKALAAERNLLQVSDTGELEKIVAQVITKNEQAANDVRNGEMKAIGFLVGQVMKASQGKANPGAVQDIIKKQLGV